MDRYNPFEKLSDLYDSIVDWQSDPLIKPENQNKYLFSDGKTYYEELCKILKLLSTFKDGFNQIYDDLDELEEQIHQSGVTQEELDQAINNLHTIITGEIALVESSLSSDIFDLDTEITSLSGRMTTAEGNIGALQTLTATHTTDIATINTAITSIQASLQTKIGDAPQDGKTYGRKNGAWNEVTGGGGGGTTDYDALDNKPQINSNILTGNKTGAQLGLVDTSTLNNYVAKTDAPGYNDILTQTNAQLIYQTIQAMSSYIAKTDAPGYADILTKTDASSIYQTILGMNDYLLKNDAPGYADILTQTSASSLYQTISGMSAYLTKTDAQTLYQTISGMSAYLTKIEAQTLYQAILQSGVNIKTINNQSLLGSSDIAVQEPLVSGTNIKTINNQSLLGLGNMTLQTPLISGTNIKTINNESILGSGNINISGSSDKPFTQTGRVNIVSSTSTGTIPTWRNVNLTYYITSDGTEFMITGQCECRGNGASSTTEITTDFVIPNIASAKTIKGFPINFTGLQGITTLEISSNGTVGIKLVNTSTNHNSLTFIPIRLKLADFI